MLRSHIGDLAMASENMSYWLSFGGIALAGLALALVFGLLYRRREQRISLMHMQELDELRRHLRDRDASINRHEQQLQVLRRDHERTRRTLADTEIEMASARQRAAELTPLLDTVHEREMRISQMHNDVERIRSTHATEIANLRSRLSETDSIRSQLSLSQQQARSLEERLAGLQRAGDEAVALLNARNADLESLNAEIRQRDTQIRGLIGRIAQLEPLVIQAAAHDAELMRLRARQAQLEPLADLAPKLQARTLRVRELENDLARLRQRIAQFEPLRGDVQQRDAEIASLLQQLSAFNDSPH